MQATPAGGLPGQRRESEQQPRRWLCDLEGLVSLPCLSLGCVMIIVPPDHAVIRESIVKHLASKKRDYIDVSYSYVTDLTRSGDGRPGFPAGPGQGRVVDSSSFLLFTKAPRGTTQA